VSTTLARHRTYSQAFLATTESFIATRIRLREEVVDVVTFILSSGPHWCIDIHDLNVSEKAIVTDGFLLRSYQ
jgi:hypothetical protein